MNENKTNEIKYKMECIYLMWMIYIRSLYFVGNILNATRVLSICSVACILFESLSILKHCNLSGFISSAN